ncbi:MAG: hypothetical protein HOH95_03650 [Dehalococcoidia bacterium]|nr:hypothetical protein [Dehalococcoidia bacterium]
MRSARALFAGVVAIGVAAVALLLRRQRVLAAPDAPSFESRFSVRASLEAVARFHSDPSALRRLTPAPMQVHRLDPMAEGSVSEFTMWMGPVPIRWQAVHSALDGLVGFTDTQERGPMARWIHRHEFSSLGPVLTEVHDRIWYRHPPRWRGVLTRMVFSTLPLRVLFRYRAWATRRALENPRTTRVAFE